MVLLLFSFNSTEQSDRRQQSIHFTHNALSNLIRYVQYKNEKFYTLLGVSINRQTIGLVTVG